MKEFYGIKDFYNALKNPKYVPTAHRHFQVYLYPIYYYQNQVVTRGGSTNIGQGNDFYKGYYIDKWHKDYSGGNGFFADWFTEETIEQFSLAIQSMTFPTKFNTITSTFVSPFGNYHGVDNDNFYGKLNDNTITFIMLDQMEPFFQKKINDWIFTTHRATVPNQAGTLFPKANIAIKYFKQTEVYPGNTPSANFIYYFKEAFPIEFTTCKIDHGVDTDADLKRSLVFQFNTMYVLHNKEMAERYGLDYLFNPITIS